MPEPFGPMIAWTSPLPTSRSIPWRISVVGLAIGATRRPRMTRRVVGVGVGHDGMGTPWRSSTPIDARWHEVGEGHRVEGRGDRVADADPQDVDGAAGRAIAHDRVLRVVGGADHRGERALERAEHLAHPDLLGRPAQLVAAVGAAGRGHEAGVAQAHDELLEVGAGELLLGGDLGEARRALSEVPPELHHQPDAVLAFRAEGDGAGAVEDGPGVGRCRVGQGRVLNPE